MVGIKVMTFSSWSYLWFTERDSFFLEKLEEILALYKPLNMAARINWVGAKQKYSNKN
jgi:hypothetical protein